MTPEDKIDSPETRPVILSTWLVVIVALLLYGLTLNHWVSLKALPLVAQITGWDWHPYPLKWRPEVMAPLFLVLTAPIRLLPAAWQPVVLNGFTAVCAALTLGLLARSVRLLPHDRTPEQRARELGEHALLSFWPAFLPALFAVALMAVQQAFWQNAVAATGEMLNLLLFAFVLNAILEYRISQNDKWLLLSSFLYGLGLANNWALLGFFPLFLISLLCVKGLDGFFNRRFLARMFWLGVAGLPLYLLIPILGGVKGGGDGFLSILHQEFGAQTFGLRSVPRWVAVLAAVPTILPMVFASIKWSATGDELSPVGNKLKRFLFTLLHCAFLALALATFFDFKYSPSIRMREYPVSFLTLYYMGALSVGYFSGYLLLVFGPVRLRTWERQHPLDKIFHFAMATAVWVISLGAPALLAWQNYPGIRAGNSRALQQFVDRTLDGLPAKKAIVLSDDPARLFLLRAGMEQRGAPNKHILIDTESFPHREYILHLESRYPELKRVMTTNTAHMPRVFPSDNLVRFMYHVTRDYPVYYLHPSFGYYFEALYLKPRGLVYELKPYNTNMTQPPLPTEAEIQANQDFWAKLENGPLKELPDLAGLDTDAETVSTDYAVSLDYWGTELQKAGHLKEAHAKFAEALRLNPHNFIAAINLDYNEHLQKGDPKPIESMETLVKGLQYYHGLIPILRLNGPSDEPGLNLQLGMILAEGGNLGQAAILFHRRLQLLPGDPQASLAMAKTYVDLRQPAKSLALISALHESPQISAWELARCKALAYMAGGDYSTAEKTLRDAIHADPNDENRVGTLAEFYRVRGLECLRERKPDQAARSFSNSLANINLQLQLLASPSHDALASFDVAEALLKRAGVEIALHSYADAVSTLSQVLQLQPNNHTALLNRALSEIEIKRFQAAKDDFKAMGRLLPGQQYLAEFGLADVASAEKNKAAEIDHLKRCIRLAPDDANEYQRASNRLAALQRH